MKCIPKAIVNSPGLGLLIWIDFSSFLGTFLTLGVVNKLNRNGILRWPHLKLVGVHSYIAVIKLRDVQGFLWTTKMVNNVPNLLKPCLIL